MLEDFTPQRIDTTGASIHLLTAGSGPPLLLLHGYPQTHVMWHAVAPALAERYTVVLPDLRGYGDSSKPPGAPDHSTYSKRASAQDQVEVMEALGFSQFGLVGHDRGARVAHRLVLDHPERVSAFALLDSVPGLHVYRNVDLAQATFAYHWYFLLQPDGLPERLIAHEPELWVRWHLRRWSGGRDDFFAPEAVAEYVRCFSDPATIHATCECYRAGPTLDLQHEEADEARLVAAPLLLLWADPGGTRDLQEIWRHYAHDIRGRGLACGHFLAEERPDDVVAELTAFFG